MGLGVKVSLTESGLPADRRCGVFVRVQMRTEHVRFLGLCSHKPAGTPLGQVKLMIIIRNSCHLQRVFVFCTTVRALPDDEIEARKEIGSQGCANRVVLVFLVRGKGEVKLEKVLVLIAACGDAKALAIVETVHNLDHGDAAGNVPCVATSFIVNTTELNEARRPSPVAQYSATCRPGLQTR